MNRNSTLNIPNVSSVRYKRNFIDIAVCELRFPTLLELESKPPLKLQAQLRKKYPGYEKQEQVDKNNLERVPGRCRYLFQSRKKDWTITIHSEAISLETRKYTEFGEFIDRITKLLEVSRPLIDTDFFTRVGLRYINKIPIEDGNLDKWINDDLSSPIISGPYGTITKYVSEMRGHIECGEYMFRQAATQKEGEIHAYVLDFDYSKEDVEIEETTNLLRAFNKKNFSFFSWCLGPKALKYLGPSKEKTVASQPEGES